VRSVARFTDPDEARKYLSSLSEHKNRLGDTSSLNPDFAVRMANAISDARAAGIPATFMSGYREGSATKSKYDLGGFSSHGYGLATDVGGIGTAGSKTAQQWNAIAQANGLHNPYLGTKSEGKEWNHWQLPELPLEQMPDQLARLRAAKASGDTGKMWAAAAPFTGGTIVASAGTAPVGTTITSTPAQPVSATAPASLSSNPFLQALEAAESGTWGQPGSGRNIYSGVDKDLAGPNSRAQGFYQITTPTWETYAAKAGVDLKQYPNAMSAPKEIQARVAMEIPFNQFGGRTRQLLSGQFGAFDTKATVGQISGSFGTPTQPGPGDASIRARGGTDVPVGGTTPAPPAVAAAPSTNMGPAPGGAAPPEFAKTPLGKSVDELAKAMTPDQQQQPPQFLNLQSSARNVSPYLGGQGMLGQPPIAAAAQMQQSLGYQPTPVYGTGLTSLPPSWSGATPGSPTQNQPQFGGFGPQTSPYGTSIGALDPMVAQMSRALALQQAAQPQQADPYGGYGYG
jgi:hypothetical protein